MKSYTFCADFSVERVDYDAHRVSVARRPSEDHDDLHDWSAQPRRRQQTHLAESGERAGVHVAVTGAPPLGRQRTGLLRQHLRRSFPLLTRVSRQHDSPCHHSVNGQVCASVSRRYAPQYFTVPPWPTQPPTLSGMGNEYQLNAVMLCGWGANGSFYLWINMWVAGKTVKLCDPLLTRAVPEQLRDEQLIIKRYTNKSSFL